MIYKKHKFIAANICTMILLLQALLQLVNEIHYNLFLCLLAYVAGSVFLFLGTLLDKKKSLCGISNKLSFYIFVFVITHFLISTMGEIGNGSKIYFLDNIWYNIRHNYYYDFNNTLLVSIILVIFAFFCFIYSICLKKSYYIKKVIFKYISLMLFFIGLTFTVSVYNNEIIDFSIFNTIYIGIVFLLLDIYWLKYAFTNGFSKPNNCGTFIMAFILCLLSFVFGLNTFSRSIYLLSVINSNDLFIILNILLACLIFCYDGIPQGGSSSDTYTILSLTGFITVLGLDNQYIYNLSPFNNYYYLDKVICFILPFTLLLPYLMFWFTIIKRNYNSKKILNSLANKKFYSPLLITLSITFMEFLIVSSIINPSAYLTPLILSAVVLTTLTILFTRRSNIANSVGWQLLLVLIGLTAVFNSHSEYKIRILAYLFVVLSISMWILNLKSKHKQQNLILLFKIINCILFGVGALLTIS